MILPMTAHIVLVEDDGPTRSHLARAIEAQSELTLAGVAANFADGLQLIEAASPDVLLTDLGLPDGSGIDLIRALRSRSPEALAMVITALGDERTVLSAVEAGATGYLLKDGSYDEIGDAVQCLLEGGSPITPSIARTILRRMQPSAASPPPERPAPEQPSLSDREAEVLRLIAKGFSYPEIAELLGISSHTVTTYVRRIYEKLEVNSRGSAVYEAVSLGLISMDD